MPHLDLTELEAKVCWLILDNLYLPEPVSPEMADAESTLFDKVYRAYRGIPEVA